MSIFFAVFGQLKLKLAAAHCMHYILISFENLSQCTHVSGKGFTLLIVVLIKAQRLLSGSLFIDFSFWITFMSFS